ncbi:orotidine 5'-phosphate decarboxylase, partial [Striga asiatica]
MLEMLADYLKRRWERKIKAEEDAAKKALHENLSDALSPSLAADSASSWRPSPIVWSMKRSVRFCNFGPRSGGAVVKASAEEETGAVDIDIPRFGFGLWGLMLDFTFELYLKATEEEVLLNVRKWLEKGAVAGWDKVILKFKDKSLCKRLSNPDWFPVTPM